MTCMKACFDQESCMSNHSPQDTNSQTTAVALTTFEAVHWRNCKSYKWGTEDTEYLEYRGNSYE